MPPWSGLLFQSSAHWFPHTRHSGMASLTAFVLIGPMIAYPSEAFNCSFSCTTFFLLVLSVGLQCAVYSSCSVQFIWTGVSKATVVFSYIERPSIWWRSIAWQVAFQADNHPSLSRNTALSLLWNCPKVEFDFCCRWDVEHAHLLATSSGLSRRGAEAYLRLHKGK